MVAPVGNNPAAFGQTYWYQDKVDDHNLPVAIPQNQLDPDKPAYGIAMYDIDGDKKADLGNMYIKDPSQEVPTTVMLNMKDGKDNKDVTATIFSPDTSDYDVPTVFKLDANHRFVKQSGELNLTGNQYNPDLSVVLNDKTHTVLSLQPDDGLSLMARLESGKGNLFNSDPHHSLTFTASNVSPTGEFHADNEPGDTRYISSADYFDLDKGGVFFHSDGKDLTAKKFYPD